MTRRIVTMLTLLSAIAADGCGDVQSDETNACSEDCDDDATLSETQAALSLPDLLAGRIFTIRGEVSAGLGSVIAAAPDQRARCDGSSCYARLGASVSLTATPAAGSVFKGWSGCTESTHATITIHPVFTNLRCSARFDGAPVRFDALGDIPLGDAASYATDVDAKGEIVVGYSRNASGDVAVRWTADAGLQALNGAGGRAQGISPNGHTIVGSIDKPDYQLGRAGVIFDLTAAPSLLQMAPLQPGGPALFLVSEGVVPVDNGQVYATCIQYAAYGDPLACRWTAPTTIDLLSGSLLYAADESGTIAGSRLPERHGGGYGSVAFLGTTELGYPAGGTCLAPHQCRSEARAFSADHSVVVGTSSVPAVGTTNTPLFDTAFVYTASEGMLRLADLPNGDEASGAFSVSPDGRVIGGFGTDASGRHAVLWIDRAPRTLEQVIQHAGGTPPSNWVLLDVRAMSTDARTFVGNARNASGAPEAFRLVLQRQPYE